MDSSELWSHALTHWRSYVLPDLQRFYPRLPADDESALLKRTWRDLREVLLSLFAIPESLTGATFARQQREDEE